MPQTPYNLLIDIGNTFVKWGRYRAGRRGLRGGELPRVGPCCCAPRSPELAAAWRRLRAPAHIVISNVAGTRVRASMLRCLEVWPDAPAPLWLVSQAEQCGVKNGYRNPAQLGSDRWAAMIGARGHRRRPAGARRRVRHRDHDRLRERGGRVHRRRDHARRRADDPLAARGHRRAARCGRAVHRQSARRRSTRS